MMPDINSSNTMENTNIERWWDTLRESFNLIGLKIVDFLPNFLAAVVVFVIGLLIAVALGHLVRRVVELLRIDEALDRLQLRDAFRRAGVPLHVSTLLGWLAKWFLVVVFLIAAADILHLTAISEFLSQVVYFIPNVVIAIIVLLIGTLLANFVHDVVEHSVSAAQLHSAAFIAGLAKWAIFVFSFLVALSHLNIGTQIMETLWQGLVGMLALAGGLAFGLGGKEHASKTIERLRKDITG